MVNDATIRELAKQSVQGLELEPTMVLADALLETDRPDLGEDLALILANKKLFPRSERGRPISTFTPTRWQERERALAVVFRRIHRRFAWSTYDREEQARALRELSTMTTEFTRAPSYERDDRIQVSAEWLEGDRHDPDSTIYERTNWLLNGTFGRGAQILAEEVIDAPPSRYNRAAQLFRLMLAFDDMLPMNVTNRVWERLSAEAKRHATRMVDRAIVEHGGEIEPPLKRSVPRRKR